MEGARAPAGPSSKGPQKVINIPQADEHVILESTFRVINDATKSH